jgi:hypothetical protein
MTDAITERITDYVRGLSRQPGALKALELSLQSLGLDQWQALAEQRLCMRQTSLLDVMNDQELEAVVYGRVSLWKITQSVLAQTHTAAEPSEGTHNVDPSILATLEAIAQRKLRRSLKAAGNDGSDFLDVHVDVIADALFAAFMAGMILSLNT